MLGKHFKISRRQFRVSYKLGVLKKLKTFKKNANVAVLLQ